MAMHRLLAGLLVASSIGCVAGVEAGGDDSDLCDDGQCDDPRYDAITGDIVTCRVERGSQADDFDRFDPVKCEVRAVMRGIVGAVAVSVMHGQALDERVLEPNGETVTVGAIWAKAYPAQVTVNAQLSAAVPGLAGLPPLVRRFAIASAPAAGSAMQLEPIALPFTVWPIAVTGTVQFGFEGIVEAYSLRVGESSVTVTGARFDDKQAKPLYVAVSPTTTSLRGTGRFGRKRDWSFAITGPGAYTATEAGLEK
jgi:hypothetical protein